MIPDPKNTHESFQFIVDVLTEKEPGDAKDVLKELIDWSLKNTDDEAGYRVIEAIHKMATVCALANGDFDIDDDEDNVKNMIKKDENND